MRGLLLAVVCAAYGNSFGLGAAMDGALLLQSDPRIQSVTGENLKLILGKQYGWPASGDWLYRPVTTASFLFNYTVLGNGAHPGGYHCLNFILHTINVWLVFELGLLLFQGGGPAFFAAALWGVHPVGVESVANIAGRADLLAAGAVLGALVLYIRMAEAQGGQRIAMLAGLFGLAALGVFSKENAAVLAGLMLLWDLTFGRPGLRKLPAYAAAGLPLLWMLWTRWSVFQKLPITQVNVVDNPLLGAGFWASRFTAVKILAADLSLLIWPAGLTSDRSYNATPVSNGGDLVAWFSLLVIAFLLCVVITRYRKDRLLFWAAGFFAIALLPTSNLVVRIGAAMAERFLYLPAVGFAAAVVALTWRWNPRSAVIVLSVATALCAFRTFARNPAWNDNFTLARTDVRTSPASFRLHAMLGQYLYSRNPRNNLDAAIRELETSWAILKPLPAEQNLETVPAALGMYYGLKGDREGGSAATEGRAWYGKSLEMLLTAKNLSVAFQAAYDKLQREHGRPLPPFIGYEILDVELGQAYGRLGRMDEAIEAYRRARIRRPENPLAYEALFRTYTARGDWASAAIMADEQFLAAGPSPTAIDALKRAYAQVPDGACAVTAAGGLNSGCARLRDDLCTAATDLEHIFTEGRRPDAISRIRKAAEVCRLPAH